MIALGLIVPALLAALLVWIQLVRRVVNPNVTVAAALTRSSVPFEGRVEIVVTLTNPTPLPCPSVTCEVELPRGLSSAAGAEQKVSYALSLGPREVVKLHFPVIGERRGRHHIQHLSLRLSDGFTMFRQMKNLEVFLTVTVHPRRTAPQRAEARMHRLGSLASARKLAPTSVDWVDMRPYTMGDSIRDVAWMISARRGELTVLERALSLNREVVLVVSVRVSSVVWEGRRSFADAVYEMTYAVMEQLTRRGIQFLLYCDAFWADDRRKTRAQWVLKGDGMWTTRAQQQMGHVLGSLSNNPSIPISSIMDEVVRQIPSPARLIVITGYLDAATRSHLWRLNRQGYTVETLWVDPLVTDTADEEVSHT